MKTDKHNMHQLSKFIERESGRKSLVDFIEVDDDGLLVWSIEERWSLHTIHIDGSETPAKRIEPPLGGYPKYFEIRCYPDQVTNGDLLFFIDKGLTQTANRT